MFWFVVFSSFLGADGAQMKSSLLLGPFRTAADCWTMGTANIERIITVDSENEYRGFCIDSSDPQQLSDKVAESAGMREFVDHR